MKIYGENIGVAAFNLLCERLQESPQKVWNQSIPCPLIEAGSDTIYCKNELVIETIAEIFGVLGCDVHTGYYDPEEDARSGETDERTGCYYVDID